MKNHMKHIAAVAVGVMIASTASNSEAGRPFGLFSSQPNRSSQRSSNRSHQASRQAQTRSLPSRSATSYANSILQSPERMEKIYGPSILVRDTQFSAKPVVSQP